MSAKKYVEVVRNLLVNVENTQMDKIKKAAEKFAETMGLSQNV
jgi:uncharacterized phosphosugar-binding protein